MNKKKYPDLVTKLLNTCEGWLIGSSANPDYDNPRDYDVFIPIKYWSMACCLIPKDTKINTLGGFKCISDNIEVDVFTGNCEDFINKNKWFTYMYNPTTGILIKRIEI